MRSLPHTLEHFGGRVGLARLTRLHSSQSELLCENAQMNTPTTRLSGRLQFPISGGSALCEDVRSRGFESFEQLAEHVRKLPYRRTANTEKPLGVLRQGRGTCSAKHQLLAAVAQDCGHSEVQLIVGIYEMSEENTPGVGAVLNTASLTGIPEAHCYLSIEGERFDFTGLPAGSSSPFAALLAEHTVSSTNLSQVKVELHKAAIAAWASNRGISKEAAWAAREACIAALAAKSSVELAVCRGQRRLSGFYGCH
jgi:hypothetical protein